MPSQEFKKAFQVLSSRCSKKETTANEALIHASKFKLKFVEKNQLINKLKKDKFIDHQRYASAFVNDRFKFYKWGKQKIKYHLLQKGIEQNLIDNALESIDKENYNMVITEEAMKRFKISGKKNDFVSKQKICKYLNQKGFEPELVFEIVEALEA